MNKKRLISSVAFAAYVLLMLWLLFGQRTAGWSGGYSLARLVENVNLVPFRTIGGFLADLHGGGRSHAVINLLGNVIMFIPLGFFVPAVFKKTGAFCRTMLWSAAAVICIEVLQLITLLGSMDIDDLLLNLAGAAIGYGVYRLIKRLSRYVGL